MVQILSNKYHGKIVIALRTSSVDIAGIPRLTLVVSTELVSASSESTYVCSYQFPLRLLLLSLVAWEFLFDLWDHVSQQTLTGHKINVCLGRDDSDQCNLKTKTCGKFLAHIRTGRKGWSLAMRDLISKCSGVMFLKTRVSVLLMPWPWILENNRFWNYVLDSGTTCWMIQYPVQSSKYR